MTSNQDLRSEFGFSNELYRVLKFNLKKNAFDHSKHAFNTPELNIETNFY